MKVDTEFLKFGWEEGWGGFFIMIICLAILPFAVPYADLATEIVCFSLLTISFNLLFGYSGLLSFAQASLFSVGAYTMGNLIIHLDVHILLGILLGGIMAALIALPIGIVSIQRIGLYFAFLTFAFNELIFYIIYEWVSMSGGDEGLRGIYRPDLNLGVFSIDLSTQLRFYFFACVIFVICFYIISRVINSPLGRVLRCIGENADRAEAIGYRVKSFKLMVFVIGAFFSGIAGALHTMFIKFADVEHCMWIFSGDIVLMTLLGGIKSLFGPMFGAVVFVILADYLSTLWDRWLFIMGFIFLGCVLFFRGGIQGVLELLFKKIISKKS
jgi:branched-chain amino acid transport system permease protein